MCLQSFCGCASLRQGCCVAAFVTLVHVAVGLVVGSLNIEYSCIIDDPKAKYTFKITGCLFCGGSVMVVISWIFLIIGLKKVKPDWLLPWIILFFTNMLIRLGASITDLIYKKYVNVVIMSLLGLEFYLWLVTVSYYVFLRNVFNRRRNRLARLAAARRRIRRPSTRVSFRRPRLSSIASQAPKQLNQPIEPIEETRQSTSIQPTGQTSQQSRDSRRRSQQIKQQSEEPEQLSKLPETTSETENQDH